MTRSTTVHKIFSHESPPNVTRDLNSIISDFRWIEFVHQASKLHLANFTETKSNLELLLKDEHDPVIRSVIFTGISRYYKGNGHLLQAAQTLGHANALLKNIAPTDANAYLAVEMAILLSITGNVEYAQGLLEKAHTLTDSITLQKYAHFRYIENKMRLGEDNVINELNGSLQYFKEINDATATTNHMKALGNAYRRESDFDSAMQHYLGGIEIAINHDYAHLATSIEHDIAMLYYHMNKYDQAISKLQEVTDNNNNYYVKCVAQANLGFIELKSGNQNRALDHMTNSLTIATEHGIFHRITGLSYYLGKIYMEQGNLQLSRFFFNQGFRAAMNMVDNHFPCIGDTLRAIKGYHNFTENHHQGIQTKDVSDVSQWEDVINTSLSETKKIFQNIFLHYTIDQVGSKRKAAKFLEMSERSIFTVLDRVKSYDNQAVHNIINTFVNENYGLTWKKINHMFESEIIRRAYEKNNKNIQKMAGALHISYAGAANKIKEVKWANRQLEA